MRVTKRENPKIAIKGISEDNDITLRVANNEDQHEEVGANLHIILASKDHSTCINT